MLLDHQGSCKAGLGSLADTDRNRKKSLGTVTSKVPSSSPGQAAPCRSAGSAHGSPNSGFCNRSRRGGAFAFSALRWLDARLQARAPTTCPLPTLQLQRLRCLPRRDGGEEEGVRLPLLKTGISISNCAGGHLLSASKEKSKQIHVRGSSC